MNLIFPPVKGSVLSSMACAWTGLRLSLPARLYKGPALVISKH